jgi:hypothetical protein
MGDLFLCLLPSTGAGLPRGIEGGKQTIGGTSIDAGAALPGGNCTLSRLLVPNGLPCRETSVVVWTQERDGRSS